MNDRFFDTKVLISNNAPMLTHKLSPIESTKKNNQPMTNDRLSDARVNANPLLSEPRPENTNQMAQDSFTFKPVRVGNASVQFKQPNKSFLTDTKVKQSAEKFDILIPPRPSVFNN